MLRSSSISTAVVDLLKTIDATLLAPHHGRVNAADLAHKADLSSLTVHDLASERALIAGLKSITPGAEVIGEESIDADPMLFANIAQSQDIWIVDPIDGTGAFTRGDPTYGIVAAFVQGGRTVQGYLYVPGVTRRGGKQVGVRQELMVVAREHEGCFLNGQRVSLANRALSIDLARVSFACRNQDKAFEAVLAEGLPGYLKRNNSAYDYASLLRGDRDAVFYSEGQNSAGAGNCPPWDHAAGVLAVTEAGGYAALPYSWYGRPYSPLQRYDRLLVAASPLLWSGVYEHVLARAPSLCAPHPRVTARLAEPLPYSA